ncbi:HGxxPAAW family protein [Herbiconiux sp. UC225_62]|uniref:HGxxPAAW family protein n=1 Tax=Herbiconiux sp. UC225_62 TaxID=3350168 RepID=UPI0036D2EC7A
MSSDVEELGEGHSPAAWTAVIVSLVGIAIGTVAFVLDIQWLVWGGAGLAVVGFILGWVLARMGYGVNGSRTQHKEH